MKKWPLQDIYFWDKAPFFRLLLPLVAGIVTYTQFIIANVNYFILAGSIATLIAVVAGYLKKQSETIRVVYFIVINVVFFAMGWLLCYYNDIRNDKHWYGKIKADGYVARITNEPIEKDKTWKLEAAVISTVNGESTRGKAFIYVYKNKLPLLFHEGDTLIVPNNWQRIKTAGNPYEFNYARYCALNNIYHQQFLAADNILLYYRAKVADLPWYRRVHRWCLQQMALYITDTPVLGLMQAMLIGDEANLDPEVRQAYAETGIIHIIAISGSHIAFFFVIISFLLGFIKHNRWKWIKYMLALPLVWAYVVVAGAPPSAVRAAVMFSVFAIGLAFERQPNSLNQLLTTAFVLLIVNPTWLYAIGFQLSIVAVLSLILFYKPVYKWYTPANKILKALWAAIAASIAAEILTAPIVIYYFHMFPLMFVVANVLAYLFMGIVLVAGMCLLLCSPIAALAKIVATIIMLLVQAFNVCVIRMQGVNPRSLQFLVLNTTELVMLFIVIAGVLVFLLKKNKAALFTGLSAAGILLCALCIDEWNTLHQRVLLVYNIGKVNHIELITGNQFQVLYTDSTVAAKTKNYVLKPAHTGFKAWRQSTIQNDNKVLFQIANKTVLILNHPVSDMHSFPVDYVIVNYIPETANPGLIYKVFTPKTIVLGSHFSRTQTDEWIKACSAAQIACHSVLKEGAFELKNF